MVSCYHAILTKLFLRIFTRDEYFTIISQSIWNLIIIRRLNFIIEWNIAKFKLVTKAAGVKLRGIDFPCFEIRNRLFHSVIHSQWKQLLLISKTSNCSPFYKSQFYFKTTYFKTMVLFPTLFRLYSGLLFQKGEQFLREFANATWPISCFSPCGPDDCSGCFYII